MKKTEMIQIDSSLINTNNESRYLELYETVFYTINETYRFLFYLDGIKEFFGDCYKYKGYKSEYFLKDTIEALKQKICLNVWKLLLDNKEDSLSIYRMKGFILKEFKYKCNIKSIQISSDLENKIKNIRNTFISHNLHSETAHTVDIQALRPLLENIYNYFQKLWIQNFVDDSLFISDGYFESLEKLYKDSVKEALKGIKL